MGIPGGLLQFAANAVKPALEVETGRNQAQLAASQQRQQQLLQMIMLQRQEREDAVANALKQAQTGSANATAAYRTSQANRPQAPVLGSPEYLNAKVNEAKALNALKPTPAPVMGSPDWLAAREADAKIRAKYAPPPPVNNVYLPSTDPSTGQTTYTVVPNRGPVNPQSTGIIKPTTGMGAGTPQQRASLEAGLRTLTSADKDATEYEDKVLAGLHGGKQATPGFVSGSLGSFADPAKHPDLAPTAGGALNFLNPDYSKYTKSLTAAANAGMLISQRPSDVRMKKETYLAGISSNPTEDLIQQARQWRADMKAAFESAIGKAGGSPTVPRGGAKYSPNNPFAPKAP